MPKRPPKRRRQEKGGDLAPRSRETGETRTADAATIAWTVSTTMVLVCNLAAALAYLVAGSRPATKGAFVMAELLVLSGAVIGLITLALTPVIYRLRRAAPPTGVTVFALCAAVAPMLALVLRALR